MPDIPLAMDITLGAKVYPHKPRTPVGGIPGLYTN